MVAPLKIDQAEILRGVAKLPAFPTIVNRILETLDDENAGMQVLARYIEHDPVLTGKIVAMANASTLAASGKGKVRNVFTAMSLVGLEKIRSAVLNTAIASILRTTRQQAVSPWFWKHSVAVGVCAEQMAKRVPSTVDYALVAGLLHDIGQLWLATFYPEDTMRMRSMVASGKISIIEAERQIFGIDHAAIGKIMVDHWQLPPTVGEAIRLHHRASERFSDPLEAVLQVAETLSHALDLVPREDHHVVDLSQAACDVVRLDWTDTNRLFGEIEARTLHANVLFD